MKENKKNSTTYLRCLGSSFARGFLYIICVFWALISEHTAAYCQLPSEALFGMNEFEIVNVGFNTNASDFGPSFVGDDLWFSAYTQRDLKKAEKGKVSEIYYSLFTAPVDGNGFTLYQPRVEVTDFKTGFHEGPVSYCEKTGELFLTLSDTVNVDVLIDEMIYKKVKIRLRIVCCKKENNKWVIKEEMPFNDKEYSVGHPSISSSGDTLFFTSDLPLQSKGGSDIFMVIRKNGSWGQPKTLGAAINTEGDEMFPFYLSSGLLIFASTDRKGNKGGLDLYCSDLLADGFDVAKPLSQFNTKYDDFGLVIHPSGESGYLVSNRPGQNGDDDIFMVKIKKTFFLLSGNVTDEDTREPVNGAEVILYNCDGKKIDNTTVNDNGTFMFKVLRGGCYVAATSASGYPERRKAFGKEGKVDLKLKHDRSFELTILDYDTKTPLNNVRLQIDNSLPVPVSEEGVFYKKLYDEENLRLNITAAGYLNQVISVNTAIAYDTKLTILMMKIEQDKEYLIENVNFNRNDWELTPSSQVELDRFIRFLKENPAIKVEIGSHTDSRESNQYNLSLSQRRAETIANYLTKKGVPKKRIVSKGYGETKLLNRCLNGVECSEEEHAKNNRIEFKIIGFVK
jgi:outer membrane protein OmpA-like peptidoglycan-associated protein